MVVKLIPVDPPKYVPSYEECIDITEEDLGEIVEENTGLHPSEAFIMMLKHIGYSYEEILTEEIKGVTKEFYIEDTTRIVKRKVYFMVNKGLMVDYNLLPVETITKLRKNSKLRKKYPDKQYTYKLEYIHPLKYKRVLQKLGVDTEKYVYWSNLEKNMKPKKST